MRFWKPKYWIEIKQGDGGLWRYYARSKGDQLVDGVRYAGDEIVAQDFVGNGQESKSLSLLRGKAAMRGWKMTRVRYVDKDGAVSIA